MRCKPCAKGTLSACWTSERHRRLWAILAHCRTIEWKDTASGVASFTGLRRCMEREKTEMRVSVIPTSHSYTLHTLRVLIIGFLYISLPTSPRNLIVRLCNLEFSGSPSSSNAKRKRFPSSNAEPLINRARALPPQPQQHVERATATFVFPLCSDHHRLPPHDHTASSVQTTLRKCREEEGRGEDAHAPAIRLLRGHPEA